jgi:hypothetical protein
MGPEISTRLSFHPALVELTSFQDDWPLAAPAAVFSAAERGGAVRPGFAGDDASMHEPPRLVLWTVLLRPINVVLGRRQYGAKN